MAKDRRFFVKLTGSAGNIEFIAVDPNQLTLSSFTQLYQKGDAGAGHTGGLSRQYIPVAAKWELKAADLSGLLKVLDDVLRTGANQLEAFKSAELFANALGDIKLWQVLLERINIGQIDLATQTLEELLWELIGSATGIAAELDQLTIKAAGHEAHADVVSRVLETEAKHLEEHYLLWGAAADTLVSQLHKLAQIMQSAKALAATIEQKLKLRSTFFSKGSTYLEELKQFNNSAADFLFKNQGASCPDYVGMSEKIDLLRKFELEVQQIWEDARQYFSRESTPITTNLTALAAEFGGAQVRLQIYEEQHKKDDPRPWEFNPDIIARELYEQAILAMHKPWPELAKGIEQILATSRVYIHTRPSMSEELRQAIDAAETRYIPNLAELTTPAITGPLTPPAPPTEPPSSLPSQTPERTSVIEELVIAVAYVLTCKNNIIAGSNLKNLLGILFRLGKVSESEAEGYKFLHQDLFQRNQITATPEDQKPLKLWATAQSYFISYRNKWEKSNRLKLKLSLKHAQLGEQMLKKHALTADMVRAAYQQLLDYYKEVHAARQSQQE